MKRLFAAIKIDSDEEMLRQYFRMKHELQRERIRWVDPKIMHLTLKFFGETEKSEIKKINTIFHQFKPDFTPFNVNACKTGIFGSNYAPRVIWFGFRQEDKLKALGQRVLKDLDASGFPIDRQNFVPHLTVARIKELGNKQLFQRVIAKYATFESTDIPVTEIILFESILRREGPIYKPLSVFRLGK